MDLCNLVGVRHVCFTSGKATLNLFKFAFSFYFVTFRSIHRNQNSSVCCVVNRMSVEVAAFLIVM